ncbi:eukaryotic translation initiation factor 2 subunit alpha-like protein [Cucumis melo var. makuwa]|uniref:Eukaryotic translation initiation factor 2 subunit alpha-like protein n=1 Tax=Cucumis melo var. makuwa TaxID=1194695 RepID=A0A5A7URL1_CUCMM|nr:eukaryotic translation initiation factor 2 subunit alpha-like protein [Cucumis melo var. makuwa]
MLTSMPRSTVVDRQATTILPTSIVEPSRRRLFIVRQPICNCTKFEFRKPLMCSQGNFDKRHLWLSGDSGAERSCDWRSENLNLGAKYLFGCVFSCGYGSRVAVKDQAIVEFPVIDLQVGVEVVECAYVIELDGLKKYGHAFEAFKITITHSDSLLNSLIREVNGASLDGEEVALVHTN